MVGQGAKQVERSRLSRLRAIHAATSVSFSHRYSVLHVRLICRGQSSMLRA